MPTERGQYRFSMKESERGFFITAEPAGDVLRGVNGLLAFDLREGANIEEAMEIAALMNAKIIAVSLTTEDKTKSPDQAIGNYAPPQDDHE
jgi:hypothetical protein